MYNHFKLSQVFELMAIVVQTLLLTQTNGIANINFLENDRKFPAAFPILCRGARRRPRLSGMMLVNVLNSSFCFKFISNVSNGESRWLFCLKLPSKLPLHLSYVQPFRINFLSQSLVSFPPLF